MNRHVDIALTGSGSLATEVIHALALAAMDPLSVALLGRDGDRLARLARSTADLAGSIGGRLRVLPIVINWSDDALIRRTIAALRPKVLVHTASLQSPWTLNRSDPWSCLVRRVGFGFTLPLQTVLALKLALAIAGESPTTFLINGCYPDAVNRILFTNGLEVGGGLGNVAILAALLWSGLALEEGRQLRMIAHHAHVAAAIEGRELKNAGPKVWIDELPIHATAENWLRNAHLPTNLNSIAGAAAVPMLFALLGRRLPWKGHSPGPLGLPGGYPVVVDAGRIELNLPPDITVAEAKARNMAAALADGIIVKDNGDVLLSELSRRALKRIVGDNIDHFLSWHASDVEERAAGLLTLRESLSSQEQA